MKKKTRSTMAMITLALSLVVSACGSDNGSSEGGKVKISFIHWNSEAAVWNELISEFESENPNIDVTMQTFPSEQYQTTAQAKLMDGSVGDVFASFPGAQFESILRAGLYTDLTGEAFVDNYKQDLIESGAKDGKQYALPYNLIYNVPVYNAGLFEQYGLTPPTDWEGFLALCEKLKSEGIIPIAFPGADIGPGQFMNPMMMNNAPDEEIFAKLESGEAKLTDEWWVKTLAQFKELNDKGYFQEGALGTNTDGAIALMAQQKAAMIATGSYSMSAILAGNPELELNLLAPITVSADEAIYEGIHTTTFMLGVNSKSKHPEEAKKFLAFLSTAEAAGKVANETDQDVPVKDIEYTSPALTAISDWSTKNTRFQPRYLITNIEIQKAVTSSIQEVMSGITPEKAAENAQAIVDQQLNL
ncbi:extracellular solute-binding protein [Paenibacillus sp. 453mf]|uniref:ABC transporter substrate-binding protein n=1 Tax=Paenibacillus sp. 453mf TaxID=1761874 RepID=UPI0008E6E84B|nr:extracellular solute-binding protein [Paenibacillus sp. 453mf]SFS37142.1 raffinose/stachyose/melibiose transport system substrate-binding protein [Paenibacillus sp. 453mf]